MHVHLCIAPKKGSMCFQEFDGALIPEQRRERLVWAVGIHLLWIAIPGTGHPMIDAAGTAEEKICW
jgi:hypothetical protein